MRINATPARHRPESHSASGTSLRALLPLLSLAVLISSAMAQGANEKKKPTSPGLVMDYGPFLSYSVEKARPAPARPATAPTTHPTAGATTAPAAGADAQAPKRGAGHTTSTQPKTRPAAARPTAAPPELVAAKGITIKLGPDAAACFDADLMRFAAGWTGGFLNLARTNIGSYKGDLPALVDGVVRFRTRIGPGWSAGDKADFTDPRSDGEGPLPEAQARYGGLYRHGEQVVLSYTVGEAKVLDLPGSAAAPMTRSAHDGVPVAFTRTIRIENAVEPLHLLVCDVEKGIGRVVPASAAAGAAGAAFAAMSGPAEGNLAVVTYKDAATLIGVAKAPRGSTLEVTAEGRVVLHLPPSQSAPLGPFKVSICNLPVEQMKDAGAVLAGGEVQDPAALCHGGPSLWKEPIVTAGSTAEDDAQAREAKSVSTKSDDSKAGGAKNADAKASPASPYVVDTVRLPDDNPWHAWIRPGGFDFFSDGRCAVCTMNGDVWIASGLDATLQHVSWKRFATGLYEPLGLKIVDNTIYVLGRDQITRLHDLDGDGEADFYENFNNHFVTLPVYHAFTFDLQADKEGNFWFVRGGNWVKPGERDYACVLKVSRDGKYVEQVANGLRAPNGTGMGPHDEFVCSDNQGHWTPACRINLVKPGGFYGFVIDPRQVHPDNASKVPRHDTYDPPICWIPMNSDNSTGGQVWVTGGKWGPLEGQMLSTSYGKCALYEVLWEITDGVPQGGTVRFPMKFNAGIMRARFSPADGQLYVAGLKGWQTDSARDGCLQRVRYTGKPVRMPVGLHVKHNGIQIDFTCALDPETANDEQSYAVEQWNYHWTSAYGSPDFKLSDPRKQGHDQVTVKSARLSPDGKSVFLEIPDLKPVMQMSIEMDLKSAGKSDKENRAEQAPVKWTIYNTINKVPG